MAKPSKTIFPWCDLYLLDKSKIYVSIDRKSSMVSIIFETFFVRNGTYVLGSFIVHLMSSNFVFNSYGILSSYL